MPVERFSPLIDSNVSQALVIGILNRLKVHVLQGHFDGCLNVQQSRTYEFKVEDHEEVMKLVVRWLMPTPHGDTTPGVKMPIINSSDDPIDDNDDDVTTVETAAQSVSCTSIPFIGNGM